MRLTVGALSLLIALGCGDGGPSGPGSLDGVVTGTPALGAVVLELTGSTIEFIQGVSQTRVVSQQASGGRWRVVLLQGTAGELRFRVRVSDLGAPDPSVVVIAATDGGNTDLRGLGGIEVSLVR